jgi:hypothetical protein
MYDQVFILSPGATLNAAAKKHCPAVIRIPRQQNAGTSLVSGKAHTHGSGSADRSRTNDEKYTICRSRGSDSERAHTTMDAAAPPMADKSPHVVPPAQEMLSGAMIMTTPRKLISTPSHTNRSLRRLSTKNASIGTKTGLKH